VIADLLIPALDEAESLPHTLSAIPHGVVRTVYVVDSGSVDGTAAVARAHGAEVISSRRGGGYGTACQRGLEVLAALPRPPDAVVFMDADFADDPGEIGWLLEPLRTGAADLVVGSRALGVREEGSMTVAQRAGNFAATTLMRAIYHRKFTDLGPFRAIRFPALVALGMNDGGNGWLAEMQVKAARRELRVVEIPVSYRRRVAGKSKIAATASGAVTTTARVLYTILRYSTSR